MQFKTKDLLVSVLPVTKSPVAACILHTKYCIHPSLPCLAPSQCPILSHHQCGGCSLIISCPVCSAIPSIPTGPCLGASHWTPTTYYPTVIEHVEDLVRLKAELAAAIKEVEAIEKQGKLKSAIGTKADAEAMERSLTEALEQIRVQKKNLPQ